MHRVVVFAGSLSWVPAILLRSTLLALSSRNDLKLAAVCVPKAPIFPGKYGRHFMDKTFFGIQSLFDPALKRQQALPWPINLTRWSQRFDFKVLVPPRGNINHPDFIGRLRNEIQPTITLSFIYLQKFGPDLLSVCDHFVNYHNGLLPGYRGVMTTAWSVYHEEPFTGFAFYRMNNEFDQGPILMQGAVPIGSDSNTLDLELEKANLAATYIPQLLRIVTDQNPGEAQRGQARYFSRADENHSVY